MDYYNVSNIRELTGLGRASAYELIVKLNEELQRDYPGSITLRAKVPKWYFEEKMKNKKGVKEND